MEMGLAVAGGAGGVRTPKVNPKPPLRVVRTPASPIGTSVRPTAPTGVRPAAPAQSAASSGPQARAVAGGGSRSQAASKVVEEPLLAPTTTPQAKPQLELVVVNANPVRVMIRHPGSSAAAGVGIAGIEGTKEGAAPDEAVGTSPAPKEDAEGKTKEENEGQCCCCVENLEIISADENKIDDSHMGHLIVTTIRLRNVAMTNNGNTSGGSTNRNCTLEWQERTNRPYPGGPPKPYEWFSFDTEKHKTFENSWRARLGVDRQCPGEDPVVDEDPAKVAKSDSQGTNYNRLLEFRIAARSAPGCECEYESYGVTAEQHIHMDDGNPLWERSYVRTPSSRDNVELTVRRP